MEYILKSGDDFQKTAVWWKTVQILIRMLIKLKGKLCLYFTVKIRKFGTPQTIAIIVLKIEKFDVTLH